LFKKDKSSAKAGLGLVHFLFINSPAVLKMHSEGTDYAIVQNTKEAMLFLNTKLK